MRQTHEWPGLWWSKVPPQVEDHPQGRELAWMARGHPFNRPVIARSNVGVKFIRPQGIGGGQSIKPTYGPFVRVELMSDGFHGVDASGFGWFRDLEWLGPLVLPNVRANLTKGAADEA